MRINRSGVEGIGPRLVLSTFLSCSQMHVTFTKNGVLRLLSLVHNMCRVYLVKDNVGNILEPLPHRPWQMSYSLSCFCRRKDHSSQSFSKQRILRGMLIREQTRMLCDKSSGDEAYSEKYRRVEIDSDNTSHWELIGMHQIYHTKEGSFQTFQSKTHFSSRCCDRQRYIDCWRCYHIVRLFYC